MELMPGTHQGQSLSHEDTYDADNKLARGQSIPGLDRLWRARHSLTRATAGLKPVADDLATPRARPQFR